MCSIETPHFVIQNGRVQPRFPGGISNELADHIAAELAPLGLVPDGSAFERIFVETVLATDPDPVGAWAAFYGKVAGPNPWPATGLEWRTPSPPPTENFEVTPVVTWEPYDFHHRPDLGLEAGAPQGPAVAPAHGDD